MQSKNGHKHQSLLRDNNLLIQNLFLFSTQEQLTCPSCKVNKKDAVLTKCFHVFCLECLKTRYETRQRKCPKCNGGFGANDYHRLYISQQGILASGQVMCTCLSVESEKEGSSLHIINIQYLNLFMFARKTLTAACLTETFKSYACGHKITHLYIQHFYSIIIIHVFVFVWTYGKRDALF